MASFYHCLSFALTFNLIVQVCCDNKTKWPFRIFPTYNHSFPCYYKNGDFVGAGNDMRGLIYIKVPKTGSTTLAGVNLRIAHRYASKENGTICSATYDHIRAVDLGIHKRPKDKTFAWTFLREPISQITSFFFWENRLYVGRPRHYAPSFHHFQTFIYQSYRDFDYFPQLGYVSPHKLTLKDLRGNETLVQEILDSYDFIGLNERFDESLVVFRLLLGLNAGDILYTKSKKNGGYDAGSSGVCRRVTKKKEYPENKAFFKSPWWSQRNELTKQLYSAVNRSIEYTIDNIIGRERFEEALTYHNYLMYKINSECADSIIFPCSPNGTYQMNESDKNCYKFDLGCGYPCVDDIVYNQKIDDGYKEWKKKEKKRKLEEELNRNKQQEQYWKKMPIEKKTFQWKKSSWNKNQQWNQKWHQKTKDTFLGKTSSIENNKINEVNTQHIYDTKEVVFFLLINWILAFFVITLFILKPSATLPHTKRDRRLWNVFGGGWRNGITRKGSDVED